MLCRVVSYRIVGLVDSEIECAYNKREKKNLMDVLLRLLRLLRYDDEDELNDELGDDEFQGCEMRNAMSLNCGQER